MSSLSSQFPSPEKYTPVLRQYLEQRAKTGEAILLFRLGDFYESFFEDAEILAKELEITLTARADSAHPGGKVPMAGIPHRNADNYIAKLLKAGFKVAICEQIGDTNGKGPMKRELVRILTPGTLVESEFLQSDQANYLAAIFPQKGIWGLALVDISTAQIKVAELNEESLVSQLNCLKPVELLVASSRVKDEDGIYIEQFLWPENLNKALFSSTGRAHQLFDLEVAKNKIKQQFGEHSLNGFGCAHYKPALQALGAILEYLEFTYPECLKSLKKIEVYEINSFLRLDEQTIKNLEIFETLRNRQKKGSFLSLLETGITTKMGSRLMREWLMAPLLNYEQIEMRQEAVEKLLDRHSLRNNLKNFLTQITDLERLAVKLQTERLNPREMGFLKNSLLALPGLKALLQEIDFSERNLLDFEYSQNLFYKSRELELALLDELPVISTEGNIFKLGYSEKLDALKKLVQENETWLNSYEAREREKTGLKSLKVCFNKASGFYIELSKAARNLAPSHYTLKQNLTNIDRYTTEELKEYESQFLVAEANYKQTEYELFCFLRESLVIYAEEIKNISHQIAQIDCLTSFAELAAHQNYIKPTINNSLNLKIENGRHPVIDTLLPQGQFVANDIFLEGEGKKQQIIILTGPNMSGKSTYMKTSALICLLAQIGSYVPASYAEIGIVDRVFTRIGASDDLSLGQSTFMVEMTETAYLLNNMTSRSLALLDEIGRGTSTYDGVAIAWSVVEYIAQAGPRTIFATHYHELNGLADLFDQIQNYQVSVHEENGELILLHKVMAGGADRSYGIEVARMAGLPFQVLNRAKGIMAQMNAREIPHKKRSLVKESIQQAKLDLGSLS